MHANNIGEGSPSALVHLDLKNIMQIDAARFIFLLSVIVVAVAHDIRLRKIPNHIVVAGALIGVASSVLPGAIGPAQSLGGLGLGLAMLLPMYALRVMGAGDVKLMAAAGAFLGVPATFFAALLSFIAGGVLALAYSVHAGVFRQTMRNLKMFIYHCAVRIAGRGIPAAVDMATGKARLPYSLAIAAGVGTYLAARFYSTGGLA